MEISAGVDHDQGHCRMAENWDFSHGSGLARERLSDSLTEQSATLSSIEQETVGRAPQFYHGAYPGAPCPRGYRADNDTTDVRFPYSSSPEEERQTAHDLKSKETKPECYRSSLPIRESRYPPREPPPRRLVQLPRPEEWVLPPTSTQRFSDIPWIPVRRKLLPVPCSTVRLIRKPVGIYESHEGSTQAHQDDYGMSSDNIRRRLVADCCEPATVRRNSGTGMRAVPEATAKRQHGEIYYHSNPKDIVSGNDSRHDRQPHIGQGSSRQNEEHPQSDQPFIADGQEGACASESGCSCCRTDYSSDEGHRPCPSHASRTKPRQATPVADVSMLVTYLKDLGSTEELPINELRQKAITLLSVTAFCRPSDLACVARPSVLPDTARGTTNLSVCSRFRMDSIKWIDEGAELVFFGSKADKGMSGNTVLIERASDPDICPITTLKAYINATATARLSVDDQPVFITLKKPYKGLSSSAIAQILSQVLKDSGQQQGVTARSIRPTGARKAIDQGVEATVVQRRGRWKSSDAFHRHYAGVTGPATDAVLNN